MAARQADKLGTTASLGKQPGFSSQPRPALPCSRQLDHFGLIGYITVVQESLVCTRGRASAGSALVLSRLACRGSPGLGRPSLPELQVICGGVPLHPAVADPSYNQSIITLVCWCAGCHAAQIIVFSVMYLQPVNRGWSNWAYSKLMMMLVFSQGLKIHTAFGWPAAFNLEAIKQWLMRVLPTSDAQYFLLAFAAAPNKPVTAVLPPFLVLAAYQLAHFLATYCGNHPMWQRHGIHIYRKMQAKQQVALAFNAQSEIGLGFLLLLGLPFPSRAPMFAFMTWQFLRMRFWSADAAIYHRQVRADARHWLSNVRRHVSDGVACSRTVFCNLCCRVALVSRLSRHCMHTSSWADWSAILIVGQHLASGVLRLVQLASMQDAAGTL